MEVNEQHRNGHAHRTPADLLVNPSPSPSWTYQVISCSRNSSSDTKTVLTSIQQQKLKPFLQVFVHFFLYLELYRMGSSLRSLDIDEKTMYTYDPSPFLLTDSHTK